MTIRVRRLAGLCLLLFACAFAASTRAADEAPIDTSAGNLLVVLRESRGANKQDESLRPFGRMRAVLPDGREVDLDISWYKYLGDMHIRLVFDGGQTMQSASADDLARLRLSPEEALKLAIVNLRRVYGDPAPRPWSGSLMQVQGGATDLISSYFLDRDFWRELQAPHPEPGWPPQTPPLVATQTPPGQDGGIVGLFLISS